jgi:hypothetical protein
MRRYWEENRHAHQLPLIWFFFVHCARAFGCIAGMQFGRGIAGLMRSLWLSPGARTKKEGHEKSRALKV